MKASGGMLEMTNELKLSYETVKELKKYGGESLVTIIQAILGDPIAIANVPSLIKNSPFFISNSVFMMKYEKMLNGIYYDSVDKISISCKLFGEDNKERVDNAIRAITIIDKIDTMTKIEYLLNANRSFGNGCISKEQLFRIANALVNTLGEDLEYLKIHATDETLIGNENVHSLVNIGAVILAGIDSNTDVEKQMYVVTEFGRVIDRYALSVMDDERQKYYQKKSNKQHTFDTGMEQISTEKTNEIVKRAAEEAKPKWNEF